MNKKRFLSLLLALALILSGCSPAAQAPAPAPSEAESAVKAGIYKSTAEGFGGDIEVSLEVDESKIVKIEVSESETPTIGGAAIAQLKEDIVNKQSINLDTVSGATVSSTAFLKAVEDALTQSGANLEDFKKAQEKPVESNETVTLTADLVVVGAGGAGLTASLSAAQGGLDVILLEKMPMVGGASAMAGGGTNATGSDMQKAYGIEDTPELLFLDLMHNGNFSNHAHTTWLYATTVGQAFNWLVSEDGANIKYKDSEPKPSAEHRMGRNFSPDGGAPTAIASLLQEAEKAGVKVMLETPAKELIEDKGVVKGVIAKGKDGTTYEISSKAVILSTGGYGANRDLLPEHVLSLPYAGAVSATGDGLLMAQKIGADTVNLNKVNIQPHSIKLPDGRGQHTYGAALAMYRGTGSILVSENGERFVNEQASNAAVKEKMEEHERSYLIMDEESFNQYTENAISSRNFTQKQLEEWLKANGTMTPVFAKAESFEELAKIINVPGENLSKSVARYNEFVAGGKDTDFGRNVTKAMSESGPYYAVEMNLRYYATLGGLRINDNMQVVRSDDSPIEGLYAAGEVVGGALGDIYAPGALYGWAMTSGYNAGSSVVKKLSK